MLILFDIDLTLLNAGGIGMRCLQDAGRSLFGDHFSASGVEYGGRLDPLIIRDLLLASSIEPSPDNARALRAGYHERLSRAFADGHACRSMPGAPELIDRLDRLDGVTLGLLTGNFEETGTLKLRSAGYETDRFAIRVWGDDSPHNPPDRAHLPPVGIARYATAAGSPITPERVLIIGDTIHDVRCATETGCRVLAVATGHHDRDQLEHAGADRVVDDLTLTESIADWVVRILSTTC